MGRYTYQKRPGQPDAAPRQAARSNLAQAVPNSAALDMLDHVQERPQAQIPAAEAEADRLSASVTSGGPEAVKAAMGRRLGADFSGIRFHMGDQAEAKAKAMNARAYTSGADIYFGEGGFDPSVAAHELVHTAQQGVVAASTPTVATPVGGVQRDPKKKKAVDASRTSKVAYRLKAPIRKMNNRVDQRIEARKNGDLEALTSFQRFSSAVLHLPSTIRSHMSSGQKKSEMRQAEREKYTQMGREMLEESRRSNPNATTLIPDRPAPGHILPEGVDPNTYIQELHTGELPKTRTKIPGVSTVMDIRQDVKDKHYGEAVQKAAGAAVNVTDKVYQAMDKVGVMPTPVPIADTHTLVTSGLNAANHHMAVKQLDAVDKKYTGGASREELVERGDHEKLLFHDIAQQAQQHHKIQRNKAIVNAAASGLKVAGTATTISGVAAPVGMALSAAGMAADAGTKIATHHQQKELEKKVVTQVLNLTREQCIKVLLARGVPVTEENIHKLKSGGIRAAGFTTGHRSEVFAHQTQKRAQHIVENADHDPAYRELNMALDPKAKDGKADVDRTAKGMGQKRTRSQVVGDQKPLATQAAQNRAKYAKEERELRAKIKEQEMHVRIASPDSNVPLSNKAQKKREDAKKKLEKLQNELAKCQQRNRQLNIPAPETTPVQIPTPASQPQQTTGAKTSDDTFGYRTRQVTSFDPTGPITPDNENDWLAILYRNIKRLEASGADSPFDRQQLQSYKQQFAEIRAQQMARESGAEQPEVQPAPASPAWSAARPSNAGSSPAAPGILGSARQMARQSAPAAPVWSAARPSNAGSSPAAPGILGSARQMARQSAPAAPVWSAARFANAGLSLIAPAAPTPAAEPKKKRSSLGRG